MSRTPNPRVASNAASALIGGGHATVGNVFFVDSGATGASDGNDGNDPARPLATLNGAMDNCTANNGDIVYLMPGHAENCSSATTQIIDIAGCRVIGVGIGSSRPTFTYTAIAGSFEINSADTYIENVVFNAGISAVVVGVNVDADNVTLQSCEWNFTTTAFDFVTGIDIDDVNYCSMIDCHMYAEGATAGADHFIRIDTADQFKCIDCSAWGDFAASPIVGEGAASTQILIDHFVCYNDDTAFAQNGIDLNVACTGIIANCRLGSLQATGVANLLDPGSCLNLENYGCNAINELGIVIGGTASA